jgi:hypothetical protein
MMSEPRRAAIRKDAPGLLHRKRLHEHRRMNEKKWSLFSKSAAATAQKGLP